MEMFSKELREMDRNTAQLMIDEMQQKIDAQKQELAEKDTALAEKDALIEELRKQLASD